MKKFYATLPSGQDVSIPEDTLEDFRVLYRGVAIRNTPYTAPLVKLVDTGDLKSLGCKAVPVQVRRGAP